MNGPRGQHDQDGETYRMPVHHRVARVRRSWWGVVAASLLGVSGAIALIVVAGTGGATADVPSALQVGAQAAPTNSVTTPSIVATAPTTTSTVVPTTTATITSPAGGPSSGTPTTHPLSTTTPTPTSPTTTTTTTTTTVSAPITIVIPKSKVTEGRDASAGSDDGSKSTTKVGDN